MSKSFFSYLIIVLFFLSTIFPVHQAQSCSTSCNQGICVSENKCACEPGYFSRFAPCDTRVPSLYNNRYIQRIVPENSWVYSYVSLADVISDVELEFQAIKGSTTAYILLQSSDSYNLPTDHDNSLLITPTNTADSPLSYLITRQETQATKGGWLTVAFYNDGPEQAQVGVQYTAIVNGHGHFDDGDDDDDATNSTGDVVKAVVFIPIMIVGLILCVGVYIRAKAENLRSRHLTRIHIEVSPDDPREIYEWVIVMEEGPQLTPQNQIYPEHILQEKRLLSYEEIQYYFPKRPFSELKIPFPHTTCSICLDDFKPESECHQLYCYHVFHEECIGEWLSRHDSCPDCRIPITREAIRELLKAERTRMKQQEQDALLSRQSPNQSPTAERLQSIHIAP